MNTTQNLLKIPSVLSIFLFVVSSFNCFINLLNRNIPENVIAYTLFRIVNKQSMQHILCVDNQSNKKNRVDK